MITLVRDHIKTFNARHGYHKVFGADVDVRKSFTDAQAIERFNEAWDSCLHNAVEIAEQIAPDDARVLVKDKNAPYVRDDEEQRRFWLRGGLFVAQLRRVEGDSGELTQLWFVPSSNPDPRTIYITFDSVDMKQTYCDVAHETGWEPEELGKHLLTQFMDTIRHLRNDSR